MSITIKLDAPALKALIADDAEFKLELQRSVTAEVVRNFVMKDAAEIVKAVMPSAVGEVIAQMRDDVWTGRLVEKALKELYTPGQWTHSNVKMTPKLQDAVNDHVKAKVDELLTGTGAKVTELYGAVMERVDKYLASDAIPGHIKHDMDAKLQRFISQRVDERLAEIKAAI